MATPDTTPVRRPRTGTNGTVAAESGAAPEVSIGMPVYNGERYLREAIDSILTQTFENLELIISDNASNDATADICAEYVRRDPRVRYVRQASNIGAPRNYSFLVGQARSRYFKWASANDICEPSMLELCIKVLERDPGVVLCYGHTRLIDGKGAVIEVYAKDFAINEVRPRDRFRAVRERMALNNAQNGLIRIEALRNTRLVRPYAGSDLTMMAALALQGKFELLPGVLFNRRLTDDSFSTRLSQSDLSRFLDPQSHRTARLDRLLLHQDQFASIFAAPIDWSEKFAVMLTAARYFIWDRERVVRELWSWARTSRSREQMPLP